MASFMDRINKGKQDRPRRLLLYGVHGVGKSTFASEAPAPIFLPTEDGLGDIDCESFPLIKTYKEMLTAITSLLKEDHAYKTAVIDSLDWLEKMIWQHSCDEHKKADIEAFGYGKGYTIALTYWRKILAGMDALRDQKGMHIVFIAHAKVEKFEDPEADTYDRYSPQLHKHASAVVQQWCDEVLFTTYKTIVKNTDEGFGNSRRRGIGTGERIMRCSTRPAAVAKNRLNLPDELPLKWSEYSAHFPTPKKKESK